MVSAIVYIFLVFSIIPIVAVIYLCCIAVPGCHRLLPYCLLDESYRVFFRGGTPDNDVEDEAIIEEANNAICEFCKETNNGIDGMNHTFKDCDGNIICPRYSSLIYMSPIPFIF